MKLSERYEYLIDEIVFAILDKDAGEIGDYNSLQEIIAEQFDRDDI